MRIFNLVLGIFGVLGPLTGVIIFNLLVREDAPVMFSIAGFVIGIIPAVLTGLICAVLYQYAWIKGAKPNILFITIATVISGFTFSYFPFGNGSLLLGLTGAIAALFCSLIVAVVYFKCRNRWGS